MIILEQDKTLLQDYVQKIETIIGKDALTKLVCESIDSLLRRQSDLPFAETIKDEYLTRIIDCAVDELKTIAVDTVTTVIGVRPEIAAAWQEWKKNNDLTNWANWKGDEHRHTAVQKADPKSATSLRLSELDDYEKALHSHVRTVLSSKASLFNAKSHPIPSMAYCQTDGFFLAHQAVQDLLVKVITDGVMVLCANALIKDVLRPMRDTGGNMEQFLQTKSAAILKILAQQMTAVNQTLHTRSQLDALGPQFKVVEKQVARQKKRSIFGVSFATGTKNVVKQVKVAIDRDSVLTQEDREAIALQDVFDALVADLPISVQVEFNLMFVQHFLDLDTGKYDKWSKEITSLVGNAKTNKGFLEERLIQVKQQLNPVITESLLLKLFFTNPERGFRIEHLYGLCLMESSKIEIYGEVFPFIRAELTRRPKELAIQFREALKTRLSVNTVETCLTNLLTLRNTLLAEYNESFDEASAILKGFNLVLSRDANVEMLAKLGTLAAEALAATTAQARSDAVRKVVRLYNMILSGN